MKGKNLFCCDAFFTLISPISFVFLLCLFVSFKFKVIVRFLTSTKRERRDANVSQESLKEEAIEGLQEEIYFLCVSDKRQEFKKKNKICSGFFFYYQGEGRRNMEKRINYNALCCDEFSMIFNVFSIK